MSDPDPCPDPDPRASAAAATGAGPAKTANFALQGGGSHGAFTWGVLDYLLEDGRIGFEGFSGTSAGAVNAAAFAIGYETAGPAGARERMAAFWRAVSAAGEPVAAWLRGPGALFGRQPLDRSPAYWAFDAVTRFLSPYQFNPLDYNPLRDVVERVLDFGTLHRCRRLKLFVAATAVRSGKIRVFENKEITPAALLASACLPYLFQAVEIDGEAYWDGGYMGNPAIFPLIYGCTSRGVVVVQVNPINRPDVPRDARAILDRVTEISFNSSLLREMRAIAFVGRLVEEAALDTTRYKKLNMHFIESESDLARLGAASKFDTDWSFLGELRDLGRATAKAWLAAHFDKIGVESSIDIHGRFL